MYEKQARDRTRKEKEDREKSKSTFSMNSVLFVEESVGSKPQLLHYCQGQGFIQTPGKEGFPPNLGPPPRVNTRFEMFGEVIECSTDEQHDMSSRVVIVVQRSTAYLQLGTPNAHVLSQKSHKMKSYMKP